MIEVAIYFILNLLILYLLVISLHNLTICALGVHLDILLGKVEFSYRQQLLNRYKIPSDFMTWYIELSLLEAVHQYQQLYPCFRDAAQIFCPIPMD
jgi:hypothetical protein